MTLLNDGWPIGTAFVVRLGEIEEIFHESYYLISCEHCIKKNVQARFSNGISVEIDSSRWCRSRTGDDVVGLDITDIVLADRNIGYIDIGDAVQRAEPHFGIGSDLYMLGLPVDEKDTGVNVPRARFGNLSGFADDNYLMKQGNDAERPCHLGDMRSRTGFSGSPVIGYLELSALDSHVNYRNRLFGIHSAQHRERIELFGVDNYKNAEIPSSMTRIVPAWIILELLDHASLIAERKERQRRNIADVFGGGRTFIEPRFKLPVGRMECPKWVQPV